MQHSAKPDDEFEMVDSNPDEPVMVKNEDAVEAVKVDVLQLVCALDDTGSMQAPIMYAREIVYACLQYLNGLVHSGVFKTLKVECHLVGLNDWKGGTWTHPCKLYLNEEASVRAKRPLAFRSTSISTTPQRGRPTSRTCATRSKDVAAGRERRSLRQRAREEYATGIHLVKEIVKRAATDYPGLNVKTFVLGCTDDAQHGMGPIQGSSDSFPTGVREADVYGPTGERAYKFACPYAPDVHPALGIPVWKPHSLLPNLRELLDIGATVVWTAVGATATQRFSYGDWLGTMAAVLSSGNGILLSWSEPDANNSVPQTVAHLLNTLITSASISEELEPLRREAVAAERAEKLISAAVAAATGIASNGNNVLHGTPTSMEAAEVQLARLVLDVELGDPQYRSLMRSAETKSDSETVAEFRSLGAKVSGAGPEPSMFGVGDALRSCASAPPRFRSLSAHYEVGDDGEDYGEPCYRSGIGLPVAPPYHDDDEDDYEMGPEAKYRGIGAAVQYRSLGGGGKRLAAAPEAAPLPTPPEPAPTPSRHLMRLMSATPKRAASVGA